MADFSLDQPILLLVIRPNCYLTPLRAGIVVALLSVPPLMVGIGFSLAGAWPVLPFAGLEVALLALCFVLAMRGARYCEMLSVDKDTVCLRKLSARYDKEFRYQRYWTQVRLVPGRSPLHPSQLTIGSHGKHVEVGRCMSEPARQDLAKQLKMAIKARYHYALD
jgi:uncharacterized membrane protein